MMTFDSSLKPEELSAAQIVARRVELDRVQMITGSFALKSRPDDLPSGIVVDDVQVSHRYEFSSEKNGLYVFIQYACHGEDAALVKSAEKGVSVFELTATFVLQYHLTTEPPPKEKWDEFFLGFAKVNGVFNSWPYLREFVQSSATRAGTLGATLPVFRVPQLPQAKQQLPPQLVPELVEASGAKTLPAHEKAR